MRRLALALGFIGLVTVPVMSCGDDDGDTGPIITADGGTTTRDAPTGGGSSDGGSSDGATGGTTDGGTGGGGGDGGI